MRRLGILILVFALLACKGRKDEDTSPEPAGDAPAGVATEKEPSAPAASGGTTACPECEGFGGCRRCGDGRPCLLCDGGGGCAICGGDGEGRDGGCAACGRSGDCPECRGDGVVSRAAGEIGPEGAPLPGQCPECLYATGLCRNCGGSGLRPDGETCWRCGGSKWCPDCRGSGRDAWCSGWGACPSCGGHGKQGGAGPETDWPPVTLTLVGGETFEATILDRPAKTINVERRRGPRVVRESIVAKNVDPLGYLTALRRYLDPASSEDLLTVLDFALARGEELLPLASVTLRSAEKAGARSPRLAAARSRVARGIAEVLLREAERALRDEKDPRSAWELYQLAIHAFPGVSQDRVRSGLVQAEALLAAEEEGLSGERRERRLAAETERLERAVRRAEEWLARAEGILARSGSDAVDRQRAMRAADRARRDLAAALSRAPAEVDRTTAEEVGTRAAAVAARAIVATALRLVEDGLLERARSLAALALARQPGSEEARRLAAVVAEAIARRAVEREEGR